MGFSGGPSSKTLEERRDRQTGRAHQGKVKLICTSGAQGGQTHLDTADALGLSNAFEEDMACSFRSDDDDDVRNECYAHAAILIDALLVISLS